MIDADQVDLLGRIAVTCLLLSGTAFLLRRWLAQRSSGRLAQLEFRRRHGARVVELLGGRLDPRRGSPWIDTYLGDRRVQLVAAPLDGRMQAGVLLLEHELPVNFWDLADPDGEVEVAGGLEPARIADVATRLRELEVDSLACGMPIDEDPRPPHVVRLRFDSVDELPDRLDALAPLLGQLESMTA